MPKVMTFFTFDSQYAVGEFGLENQSCPGTLSFMNMLVITKPFQSFVRNCLMTNDIAYFSPAVKTDNDLFIVKQQQRPRKRRLQLVSAQKYRGTERTGRERENQRKSSTIR